MISWYKSSKFPVDRLIKFYPVSFPIVCLILFFVYLLLF